MPDDVSALQLLLAGDPALLAIVRLSLVVSLSAVVFGGLMGVPFGAAVALIRFPGREAVIVVLNALMGLPPVVVGLPLSLLLSRSGPLGSWGLLFTPQAMIVAQTVLIAPIIAALTRQTVEDLWSEYREELAAMDVGPLGRIATLIWDGRFSLVTALLAGFGRAAAEVGAVLIVGGNIDGFTRTMTTAIALETSKGDLPLAIGLGLVLIADVAVVNAAAWGLRRAGERFAGCPMRAPITDLPIVLEDVSFSAGGVTILEHISLALAAGSPTVLIGPNGAGKTPLLRLIMGLIPPTRGRVSWGGREQAASTHRAIVFQRPAMLRRSAAGNIRYALAAAGVPRSRRAAHALELGALVGLTGLDRRPARKLSGGEQQRLALARALAKEPQILLLDEPTASLDPAATKAIEDVIRKVAASGIKVVMSTHDLGEAKRLLGEIVLVHRGRVIESGPADAFFSAPKTEEARRFTAGELLV